MKLDVAFFICTEGTFQDVAQSTKSDKDKLRKVDRCKSLAKVTATPQTTELPEKLRSSPPAPHATRIAA